MDSLPPSTEKELRPLTFLGAVMWTLLSVLLVSVFAQLARGGRDVYLDMVTFTGCEVLAYSVVLFAILRIHEPETSIRRVLALRPPPVLAVLLAIAIGAALALPSEWLGQLLASKFKEAPQDEDMLEHLFSIDTASKRVALAISVALIQPIADELFFRGALFTPLRRTRKVEEVVLATAAFETLRSSGNPRAMIIMLFASLVFSWLRAVTGSVVPSLVARVAYLGVVTVPVILGRDLPKPTKVWLAGTAALALVGLFGIAALGRRDARILEARRLD